nr:MAG TPA: hypothetical protein [Caudoviricetes sp.]
MERKRESQRELAKFLYDLAKTTFATMVVGSLVSLAGLTNGNYVLYILSMIIGVTLVTILACTANGLKNYDKRNVKTK